MPARVAAALERRTGRPWQIVVAGDDRPAAPTLAEEAAVARRAQLEALADDPRIKPVLQHYPGAAVVDVRPRRPAEPKTRALMKKFFGNMLKQAQELQTQKMAEMQAKFSDIELDGSAGGGMVTVTLNGKGEMRRVKIGTGTWQSPMKSRCSRILVAAFNDAKAKVEAHVQEEIGRLTGGIELPAGFKLPF